MDNKVQRTFGIDRGLNEIRMTFGESVLELVGDNQNETYLVEKTTDGNYTATQKISVSIGSSFAQLPLAWQNDITAAYCLYA